jgi:hypothetical protein
MTNNSLSIWGLAVGGSILGSIVIAILGYMLVKANYPTRTSEWSAEILGAVLGMGLSVPAGIAGGGLAGTWRATSSKHADSKPAALNASSVALVVGALVSGVVLAPTTFFLFILEHI